MARNDEGEFELILGNRQLVSVFLIVVILLGVFFSMGYIVGRNASPAIVAENHAAGSGKTIVLENPARSAAPPAEEPAASPAATPLNEPAAAAPFTEKPSPAPGKPVAGSKLEEPRRLEPKAAAAEPAKRPAIGEPPPGVYLQVVATSRADAEIVSESLVKKGFRAIVAPIPDSTLHRVLVGPYRDAGEMADGRTKLEATGFKPYVRKY